MTFGLAGAHGTGKTTLAHRIRDEFGLHYYDGSSGRIMKELGYNSIAAMTLSQRIEAQFAYFNRYLEEIGDMPRPFITDRTPLDMVGYMLAETTMHSDASLAPRIVEYVGQCINATGNIFDTVVFVQPFGAVPERDGKPPLNEAYQLAVQLQIEGTISKIHRYLGAYYYLNSPDIECRMDAMGKIIEKRIDVMCEQRIKDKLSLH